MTRRGKWSLYFAGLCLTISGILMPHDQVIPAWFMHIGGVLIGFAIANF